MPALIDDDLTLYGNTADWETDPELTLDPAGFDSVKATICFRGTATELAELIPLGSQSAPDIGSSLPLFYTGPRVQEARFGYQIADLEWKGLATDPWSNPPVNFLDASAYVRGLNVTMTTDESEWPREVNDNTLYLGAPYAPPASVGGAPGLRTFTAVNAAGAAIVTGYLPWRVRIIGRAWAVSMSGIIAGPRSIVVRPPKCTIPKATLVSGGLQFNDWLATGDPLVTWADETNGQDGWVCRNYQLTNEQYLGPSKILSRWTADFQWVPRYGP